MTRRRVTRAYSRYTRSAVALLGGLIREARVERKMTAQEVSDRAGISRGLLRRIESGDLKCEIGAAFEVAAIVGVELFQADETSLARFLNQKREKLSLLPKSIRRKVHSAHDRFSL